MNKSELEKFEKKIGVIFKDKILLNQVFVHRSYINEHSDLSLSHNERLEFLGDAVLELVVTEYLYKTYPNPEGELTNWRSAIVKGEMLAVVGRELSFSDYLMVSRGEEKSGGKTRDLLLANALEALIGAMYLDQGYTTVKTFLGEHLLPRLSKIIVDGTFLDSKSKLQEIMQEKENVTPEYKVLEEAGPDHSKHFLIGVCVGKKMIGKGEGPSKRKAEQQAAQDALQYYI